MRCLVSRQSKKPQQGKSDRVGSHVKKDELLTLSLGSSVAATGAFSVKLLCGSLDDTGALGTGTAGECCMSPPEN